jgi:hypothetical protein
MHKNTLKRRVTSLENKTPELPIMVLWGDWDNPDLCYTNSDREGEPITWQAAEGKYTRDFK